MKINAIIFALFGVFIFVGGVIGFRASHSTASLVMGSSFSFLLMISSFAAYKKFLLGYFFGTLLTSILLLFFLFRFYTTLKFMPSGMMALMSFVVLVITFVNNRSANKLKIVSK